MDTNHPNGDYELVGQAHPLTRRCGYAPWPAPLTGPLVVSAAEGHRQRQLRRGEADALQDNGGAGGGQVY